MTYFLGVDPDTKNTAFAVLHAGALCLQGLNPPVVTWTDVASVDPDRDVEWRIHAMLPVMGETVNNLCYNLSEYYQDLKIDFAIVEGQEKYPKDKVRPNDLIHLAQVAGMAAGMIAVYHEIMPHIVRPRKWKGSVPKKVHQQRILSKVVIGVECDYLDCTKTQQGHVIDAMGLAYYGFEQFKQGLLK